MINIHKQLWVVRSYENKVEDSEYLLSYMTHREYNKDGAELQSFENRKSTGLHWAVGRYSREKGETDILEFDNTPVKGFRIIGSVTRWSTSNKLIRVEDPRGFVVEIPTGNLTTLLKHTIVDKCVVMEECVWGREGSNHLLLPVNSDVYKQAFNDTKLNSEKVSFSKLVKGSVVKFSVDDETEYVYLGKGKASWDVDLKRSEKKTRSSSWYSSSEGYIRSEGDEVVRTETVEDVKWCHIFKLKGKPEYSWTSQWYYKVSGKCIVVKEGGKVPKIVGFTEGIPERVYYANEWMNRYPSGYEPNYIVNKGVSLEMK